MRLSIKLALTPLFLAVLYLPSLSHAAQYGLVVGIDNYKYGADINDEKYVRNLDGAENDAIIIAETLRLTGVDLPDSRLLIGDKATLAAFEKAWESLLNSSKPGDNLIVTFAGHGGKEKEHMEPFDEQDSDDHDETLMFWDFNPQKPTMGRLVDDKLYEMLAKEEDRRIIFVADSCYSGGMTRSMDFSRGKSREGGSYEIEDSLDDIADLKPEASEGEDFNSLSHVTYLTATDDESQVVTEILYEADGKPHGALSVSFAEGLKGKADTDNDNLVLRQELQVYVEKSVRDLTSSRQSPDFLPRGGDQNDALLFAMEKFISVPAINELVMEPLRVAVEGGDIPKGVNNVVKADDANLRFVYESKEEVVVYYDSDKLIQWPQSAATESKRDVQLWQKLVDKFRLLNAIDENLNTDLPLMTIEQLCRRSRGTGRNCGRRYQVGELLKFTFDRPNDKVGDYFVLFNLAGDGELQMQYPINDARFDDDAALSSFPYKLELNAAEPIGRDDLVAALCKDDPMQLKRILMSSDGGHAPEPAGVVDGLNNANCQTARIAFFTASKH